MKKSPTYKHKLFDELLESAILFLVVIVGFVCSVEARVGGRW